MIIYNLNIVRAIFKGKWLTDILKTYTNILNETTKILDICK